ncbi:MAG: dihydroorotate dehydrogenase [Clostridiales bacterium]|jgi:dihydroorotate dehydrogenase (NAD+) catalytic subunit|nr:dihydroorotate dehydrogenase [Clostridiales bacterium]
MVDLSVDIAGVKLKNPVTTASGTFASGKEYADFVDLNKLGAITVKGVSITPWQGNPPPRIAETYGGLLNSVGLQNPGVEAFIKEDLPFLKQFDTKIIVNICGHTEEEYAEAAQRLSTEAVDLLELNISCPNLKKGGIAFGQNPKMAHAVVREVKKYAKQPLIVKLSPNVTDITEIAKAAEDAGADALSLINTILGMQIDINRRRPVLYNVTGGLSGPAVKPVAVRMVYQTARCVKIPIIGMGGICSGGDAVEFLLAGATAVAVGSANFANPNATTDVLNGICEYMQKNSIAKLSDIKLA